MRAHEVDAIDQPQLVVEVADLGNPASCAQVMIWMKPKA